MKLLDFDVGDIVYLYGTNTPDLKLKLFPWPRFVPGHYDNKLMRGTVVLEFQRNYMKYYIVEVDTGIEPIMFVRDGFSLSDSANKPIGAYRR